MNRYPYNTGPTPEQPWPMVGGQPISGPLGWRGGRVNGRGVNPVWTDQNDYDGTLELASSLRKRKC